ncbi:MAG: type II secretion system F family protein [Chthoniobacteraceae bacterium]|nr:type II secretion system F family protein [Chthoniobacteraceae bacterium]
MPEFAYTARKPDGLRVQGSLEARDRCAAIARIEQEAGVPIQVSEAARSTTQPAQARSAGIASRIPLSQLFLFTEQLAHLLSAGMTLDESLGVLVRRLEAAKLNALVRTLHQALVDGRSLSQAMRDFPGIFSPLYVNMVAAGEVSGALPQILRRLVTHIANIKSLRDRVQQALVYPAALVVVGIGLIVIFMTVMVPQLTKFLKTTGQALPAATRMLINANALLTHYWWAAALAAAGCYGAWKIATRSADGRCAWDRLLWTLPALSRIPRYRFYAQFARTLATLSENGVTLLQSLALLEEISGNEWVRLQMVETRNAVMDGAGLSSALRRQKLFPPLFLDMMAVGEQTGRFAETMSMIADVHERELDKQVQFVSTLVPLVVITVIALLVGLMVYAILSAVFGLTSGLQGRIH